MPVPSGQSRDRHLPQPYPNSPQSFANRTVPTKRAKCLSLDWVGGGSHGDRHSRQRVIFEGDRLLAEPGNRGTDIHDRSIPTTPPALSPPRPLARQDETKCLTPDFKFTRGQTSCEHHRGSDIIQSPPRHVVDSADGGTDLHQAYRGEESSGLILNRKTIPDIVPRSGSRGERWVARR
jgi:hypothetical protein